MARFRQPYSPRPRPERLGSALDDLSLHQVGLGPPIQIFLFVLSLFPFAGMVIGAYYANNEHHFGTRSLGRMLLAFSLFLNFVYFCVLCPLSFYVTFS